MNVHKYAWTQACLYSRLLVAAWLRRCDAFVAFQRMSLYIFLLEHLFVSPCAPSLVHHVLHSPARAPNTQFHRLPNFAHTETLCPSLHTPLQSSIRPSSKAHSENPAAHHICLPTWICVITLPSHPPSTTHTQSKERTKTASCCEAGRRHEAEGFPGASKTPARFVLDHRVASSRAAPART